MNVQKFSTLIHEKRREWCKESWDQATDNGKRDKYKMIHHLEEVKLSSYLKAFHSQYDLESLFSFSSLSEQ